MSGNMEFILSWAEAAQMGAEMAGGKGWNLGRLHRYGFKVTPGLVLSTSAYLEFIDYNGLAGTIDELSERITQNDFGQYEGELSELREKIVDGDMPDPLMKRLQEHLQAVGLSDRALAVRSSASAEDSERCSFAGIHESFLNVLGMEAVEKAIKGCYASLWTPQAVAYRRRFELADSAVIPAVVIMQMVEAKAAGIAFSCDPQSGRRDRLVVQANFGLGESVVSGAIEPDCYYLDASAWYAAPPVVECRIGSKKAATRSNLAGGTVLLPNDKLANDQVLAMDEIGKLGRLILRVFEALGEGEHHVDIEWAYDGEDFFILQSRPVTALPVYTFEGFRGQQEIWSNGNYREGCPMVLSPLHRLVMKNCVDTIQYNALSQLSYPIPEGFQFSRFFNGRMYCNISAVQWSYWDCSGMLPENFTSNWGGHQPAIDVGDADPYQGECGQVRLQRVMHSFALTSQAAAESASIFNNVIETARALSAGAFESIPDSTLVGLFEETGTLVKSYSERFNYLAAVGSLPVVMLMRRLAPYLGENNMFLINGLMVGGESGITSADHGYRLLGLAEMAWEEQAVKELLLGDDFEPRSWQKQLPDGSRFKQAFEEYMEEFGHRALYELDISNPRWNEDPAYLFDMIRSTMSEASLEKFRANQSEKERGAWQKLRELVPETEWEAVQQGLKESQQGAAVREMTKSVIVTAFNVYRKIALEVGRRFKEDGLLPEIDDIFYCTWPDIIDILTGSWTGEQLHVLAADRKVLQQQKETLPAPDLIMGNEPVFCQPKLDKSGTFLQGVGAAAGQASGLARMIKHPAEGNRLHPGEVLVAPSTDPAWTPLFLKASALVMETGGYLCHGSIVAREYGVPAVVNVAGVMRQIEDGQSVTVDGDQGRVYLS